MNDLQEIKRLKEGENAIIESAFPMSDSEAFVSDDEVSDVDLMDDENDVVVVGFVGCGAIARTITDCACKEDLGVHLKFFYDQDVEMAESLALKVGGTVSPNLEDMLDRVDLVVVL